MLYEPVYKFSLMIFPTLETNVQNVKELNDLKEEIIDLEDNNRDTTNQE